MLVIPSRNGDPVRSRMSQAMATNSMVWADTEEICPNQK
jgi:hypothetical protein